MKDTDNLIALSNGEKTIVELITQPMFSQLPAYRPIPQLTIFFQYQMQKLNYLNLYLVFNLFLWTSSALALYYLVFITSKSYLASLIASSLFLLDWRAEPALVWIGERQNSLAVLSGILLLIILKKFSQQKINKIYLLNIFLLLITSVFSKEFGLVFLFLLPILGYFYQIKNKKYLYLITGIVLTLFILTRFFLIAPNSSYCPGTAFFTQLVPCLQDLPFLRKIAQYFYHIGASLLGFFLPNLFFNNRGMIFFKYTNSLWPFYIMQDVIYLSILLVVVSFFSKIKSKEKYLALLIIIFSALISFPLFRPRNHLTGMIGVYWLLAMSLPILMQHEKYKKLVLMIAILTIAFFGLIIYRSIDLDISGFKKINVQDSFQELPLDINKKIAEELNRVYQRN